MEPRELRIGNLFYPINRTCKVHLPDEIPFIIMEITQFSVKGFVFGTSLHKVLNYHEFSIREVSQIKLTEDWLIKFGFFKVEDNIFDIEIENRYLSIDLGKKLAYVGHRVDWITIKFPESIHQLQNLYFALTGEELTIQP